MGLGKQPCCARRAREGRPSHPPEVQAARTAALIANNTAAFMAANDALAVREEETEFTASGLDEQSLRKKVAAGAWQGSRQLLS